MSSPRAAADGAGSARALSLVVARALSRRDRRSGRRRRTSRLAVDKRGRVHRSAQPRSQLTRHVRMDSVSSPRAAADGAGWRACSRWWSRALSRITRSTLTSPLPPKRKEGATGKRPPIPHEVDASNQPLRWSGSSDGGSLQRGNIEIPVGVDKRRSQNRATPNTPGPINTRSRWPFSLDRRRACCKAQYEETSHERPAGSY